MDCTQILYILCVHDAEQTDLNSTNTNRKQMDNYICPVHRKPLKGHGHEICEHGFHKMITPDQLNQKLSFEFATCLIIDPSIT
jgi:hypothetical protein